MKISLEKLNRWKIFAVFIVMIFAFFAGIGAIGSGNFETKKALARATCSWVDEPEEWIDEGLGSRRPTNWENKGQGWVYSTNTAEEGIDADNCEAKTEGDMIYDGSGFYSYYYKYTQKTLTFKPDIFYRFVGEDKTAAIKWQITAGTYWDGGLGGSSEGAGLNYRWFKKKKCKCDYDTSEPYLSLIAKPDFVLSGKSSVLTWKADPDKVSHCYIYSAEDSLTTIRDKYGTSLVPNIGYQANSYYMGFGNYIQVPASGNASTANLTSKATYKMKCKASSGTTIYQNDYPVTVYVGSSASQKTLTIKRGGSEGGGRIIAYGGGKYLSCDLKNFSTKSSCEGKFPNGSRVTLKIENGNFSQWGGKCSGTETECIISSLNDNETALAYFSFQDTNTFSYIDSEYQIYTVPKEIYKLKITAYGAGSSGGKGGMAQGVVTVSPGDEFYIYVGGQPSGRIGGWNGGGNGGTTSWGASGEGGGGASDVRQGGTALTNRIIVGGGGGGYGTNDGGGSRVGGKGGIGGGTSGSGGGSGANDAPVSGGGGGGTQASAGSAGTAGGGNGGASGNAGAVGTGGAGGIGPSGASGGGGGGGGYFGGGGGGVNYQSAGGGGGGSSYIAGLSDSSTQSGVREGNGQVIIQAIK